MVHLIAIFSDCIPEAMDAAQLEFGVTRFQNYWLQATSAGISRTIADNVSKIGDRDIGIGQVRVPELLPLETEESFVSNRAQGRNLSLYRHSPAAGEHVILPVASRIFQVSMPDPLA
jgi:hypothetical protein